MTETPAEVVIRLRLEFAPGVPQLVAVPDCDQPLLYRLRDAAKLLAIGQTLLEELVARGDIESVKVSDGARRISRDALEAYVARHAGGDRAP